LTPACPQCGSERVCKDGFRNTNGRRIQRYLCKKCGYRFSDPSMVGINNKYAEPTSHGRRVSAAETKVVKNLTKVESRIEKRAAGATNTTKAEIKGRIVEFAWWMKKQGYAETTITVYTNVLEVLSKRGASILNSESVKDVMARQEWSSARKTSAIAAYTLFLRMLGMSWDPPICHRPTRKLPFIPMESEIDRLIAACGKKTGTFLQTIKETAMRSGEANRLGWTDIDFAHRTITLNKPEKGGNPRIFKVSLRLIAMLKALPRTSMKVFGDSIVSHKRTSFLKARKTIATKLQNPRLIRITFHTLRHWKATTLYHQTKDILYVKEFLGHRKIEDTLLYVQLAKTIFKGTTDEFTIRIADKPEEIKALLEVGFEYVCEKDGLMFFRKRK
jgi:integrase